MMKRNPELDSRIIAMRQAGWSVIAIAEREGVSTSTVERALRDHHVSRGKTSPEVVEAARLELQKSFGRSEALQQLFTELVGDTVSHIVKARRISGALLDDIENLRGDSAPVAFRALAAHATATKAHADILRLLLPQLEPVEELPVLRVEVITEEEVSEIRRKQREEEFGWDDEDPPNEA